MLRVVVLRVCVSRMRSFVYVHAVPHSQVSRTCVVHVRVNERMVGAQRCRLVRGCMLLVSRVSTCFVEVRFTRRVLISACVRVRKRGSGGRQFINSGVT